MESHPSYANGSTAMVEEFYTRHNEEQELRLKYGVRVAGADHLVAMPPSKLAEPPAPPSPPWEADIPDIAEAYAGAEAPANEGQAMEAPEEAAAPTEDAPGGTGATMAAPTGAREAAAEQAPAGMDGDASDADMSVDEDSHDMAQRVTDWLHEHLHHNYQVGMGDLHNMLTSSRMDCSLSELRDVCAQLETEGACTVVPFEGDDNALDTVRWHG